MKIHIVAGGPSSLLPDLKTYDNEEIEWIGVDRGVFYLLDQGLKPTYAFGDFDSVTKDELRQIEDNIAQVRKFIPEKDETDMELALGWAMGRNPESIVIFGATGGRLDHFFANIHLLVKPEYLERDVQIEVVDLKNSLQVRNPGVYHIGRLKEQKYISFIPISTNVKGLTLKNFKYPLKDCHIPIGSTLCISNELIDDYGTFSFSEGILLVVRSSD